jgi:hypothetical protein
VQGVGGLGADGADLFAKKTARFRPASTKYGNGSDRAGCTFSGVSDALPPDPDLDDLPEELRERSGLRIVGRDPETGEVYSQPITREELGSAFADARRRREDELGEE